MPGDPVDAEFMYADAGLDSDPAVATRTMSAMTGLHREVEITKVAARMRR